MLFVQMLYSAFYSNVIIMTWLQMHLAFWFFIIKRTGIILQKSEFLMNLKVPSANSHSSPIAACLLLSGAEKST